MTTEKRLTVKTKEDHLLSILLSQLRKYLTDDERDAIRAIQNYELVKKHRDTMGRDAFHASGGRACIADAIGYMCESRMAKKIDEKIMYLDWAENDIKHAIRQLL